MTKPIENWMIVEGNDDMRVIPELIEANGIRWGTREDPIVTIEALGGVDEITKPNTISTTVKQPGLRRLSIVVDANADPEGRWQRIRGRCIEAFPELPEALPRDGAIATNDAGLRLGVWLLPDNGSRGMMETFLAKLVPDDGADLWAYAQEATAVARQRGASYKDTHADKARIHAWLAWQDPPGQQLHSALIQNILDPRSPYAEPFVQWFRKLYEVDSPIPRRVPTWGW